MGLGTIINVGAIAAGGALGLSFGRFLRESWQEGVVRTIGVCTLFLGIAGTLGEMLRVGENGQLAVQGSLMLIVCMALGVFIGELINLDGRLEALGVWLREKSGSSSDPQFVNGFVTAFLTVCIGAMAVVGAVQDGLAGDWSTLAAKSVLDFIIVLILSSTLGKGCLFSALPVGAVQGSFTLLARLLAPVLTEDALSNLSLVGSAMIFCVGVNLVWPRTIRVANQMPALVLAAAWAFLPF